MSVFDLYSKRLKRSRGETPDIFQYESMPSEFRVQVVHILRDALGEPREWHHTVMNTFKTIHDALCREYGLFLLTDDAKVGDYTAAIYNFLLRADTDRVLDVIELTFKIIDSRAREWDYRQDAEPRSQPDDAISELNHRFLEHGIGFQFESGQVVRVDSKFAHSEIVKPALQVLSDKGFKGANEEFLKAHEHYRHCRYKECLNECLKAFESTMKSVCKKHHWQYDEGDAAKRLLEICFQKGLIPTYLQAQFSSLRASLESGVPTVRNKLSGHGQGTVETEVPSYLASYLLNLTATSILLLANAEKALP
jgi:hypothetical protein